MWEKEPHRINLKATKPIISILKGSKKPIQSRKPSMPKVMPDEISDIAQLFRSEKHIKNKCGRKIKKGFLPVSHSIV